MGNWINIASNNSIYSIMNREKRTQTSPNEKIRILTPKQKILDAYCSGKIKESVSPLKGHYLQQYRGIYFKEQSINGEKKEKFGHVL